MLLVYCCRPDAGSKFAKTNEVSNPNQFNSGGYDGATDYSGYSANSAYNYNTSQWPGYGTAQQQVCDGNQLVPSLLFQSVLISSLLHDICYGNFKLVVVTFHVSLLVPCCQN